MPNHLISETSPYLIQHAHNPVDWYPWGPEALEKARREQKLLVISIGYAACHWCHVMEHESFWDPGVADLMNRYFISIKVDREERPDIDQLYMNAAYLITGRGGWPLNVIALPDQKPVFAGTYFPKHQWLQVLRHFAGLFEKNRDGLDQQAEEVIRELKALQKAPGAESELERDPDILKELFTALDGQLDYEEGGMHGAPKFPMPPLLSFLMKYAFLAPDHKARDYVMQTLKNMSRGGLYDQLGGGFCRYSVDARWRVPHFEKMLYDNAQLVTLYSDAFRWSGEEWARQVVMETTEFIRRELTSPGGLFLSSLDADSEGKEGAYYTWTADEIRQVAGMDAEAVMNHFGISEKGNWEDGRNILFMDSDANTEPENRRLRQARNLLFLEREKRSRPSTDIKVLTAWNALMIKGYVSAYRAFGNMEHLDSAIRAASFFARKVDEGNGKIHRNYTRGIAAIPAFLDDYAFLGSAFLDLYESTFEPRWLMLSENLAGQLRARFTDPVSGFFRYTSGGPGELTGQVIETSDNVIPASNSELASLLLRLGLVTGNEEYTAKSLSLLKKMYRQVLRNPAFHANWCSLLADYLYPPAEVAITGTGYQRLLHELRSEYIPGAVFYGGAGGIYPETLTGKFQPGRTLIYVCRDKACFSPVETVSDAMPLILGPRAVD